MLGEAQRRAERQLAKKEQQQKEMARKKEEGGGDGGTRSTVTSKFSVSSSIANGAESVREEEDEETAAVRQEVMIARMQRLTMAFAADEDDEDEDELYPRVRPADSRSRTASAHAAAATLAASLTAHASADGGNPVDAQVGQSAFDEPEWLREAAVIIRTPSDSSCLSELDTITEVPQPPNSMPPSPNESAKAVFVPKGYLLKRSPAKSIGLLQRFAWQRRWFEVSADAFSWYASSDAAVSGQEPLGRVLAAWCSPPSPRRTAAASKLISATG